MSKIRPFKRFSEFTEEFALSEELPYWDFLENDNTVALADGSLVQGMKLRGLSIEAWDDERVNQLTGQLRSVLNSLPDGAEIQIVVDSVSDFGELIEEHERLSGADTPVQALTVERVAYLRQEEKSRHLQRAEIRLFVFERIESKSGFRLSFFDKPSKFQTVRRTQHQKRANELSKKISQLESQLSSLGLGCELIPASAIRGYIYRFLNPTRCKTEPVPQKPAGSDAQDFTPDELRLEPALSLETQRGSLCLSDLILNAEGYFLDGLYHRIITLKSLPENTFAAMASRLMSLPHGTTLSFSVQVPEQSHELSQLQIKRRMAHSMSGSHEGRASDLESEARLQSTEELLRELIQTGQKILYTQLSILVRDETLDGLDQKVKTVLARIRELSGAEGLTETVATLKVLKSMLPAGTTTLVRPKRMKTDNAADFMPIYEPYAGSEKAVCLFHNRYGGLVSYDPFDSILPNFNTLVTGSSGAGKSFLNNCILLQFAAQKPMIFIIDIGGSYKKLCEFMGGTYLEIVPPQNLKDAVTAINPMLLPAGETEPSPQKIKFLLSLLEVMLTDSDDERLKRLSKSLLEEAIVKTYKRITDREVILSDLVETLRSSPEKDLQDFAKMLYPWTSDRPYGRLLDRAGSLNINSPFVVFDLKGLSAYEDLQSVFILIITDFILGQLGMHPGVFKQILMDECWELLKSRAASGFMEYCARTIRKLGGGITFITQGLEEIVRSPIGPAILNNTANKFILLQRGDLEPIRSVLKLNNQEMQLISSLKSRKGDFSEAFMMANESRSVVRIQPIPLEYWLSTSDARDNHLVVLAREKWPDLTLQQIIEKLAKAYPAGSQGAATLDRIVA